MQSVSIANNVCQFDSHSWRGSSWLWSYASWIYNYRCNECLSCEFEFYWWRGVLDTTLYDKICQWLATGQSTLVSPANKADYHDIADIMLKVSLNQSMHQRQILFHVPRAEYSINSLRTTIRFKCWKGVISISGGKFIFFTRVFSAETDFKKDIVYI